MKKQNLVIACVSLSLFISFFLSHALSVAVPFISRTFNTLPSFTTYVVSAYPIALACFLLPATILAKHFSTERIFVTGLISCAFVTILLPFSPNFTTLVIGRILQGACASLFLSTSMTMISTHVALERRYMAVGISVALTYIGISTSLALGGLITEVVSFHAMLDVAGILLLVVAYFSHFIPSESAYAKGFEKIPFAKISLFISSVGLFLISLSALSYTNLAKYGIAISFVLFISLVIRDYQDGAKENYAFLKEKARLNRHKKLARYGRFSKQIAYEDELQQYKNDYVLDVNTNDVMSNEDAELLKHVAAIKAARNNTHQNAKSSNQSKNASLNNNEKSPLPLNDFDKGMARARAYALSAATVQKGLTKEELDAYNKSQAFYNQSLAFDTIPTLVSGVESTLCQDELRDELAWQALDEGARMSELNDVVGIVPTLLMNAHQSFVTATETAHYNKDLADERLNNFIDSIELETRYHEKHAHAKNLGFSFKTPSSDFADLSFNTHNEAKLNVTHAGATNLDEDNLYLNNGLCSVPNLVNDSHHHALANVEAASLRSAVAASVSSKADATPALVDENVKLSAYHITLQSTLLLNIKKQFASIFNGLNSGFSSYTVPTLDHLHDDEIFNSDSEVEEFFSKQGLTAFCDLVDDGKELLVGAFSSNVETANDAMSQIHEQQGEVQVDNVKHIEASLSFKERHEVWIAKELAETASYNVRHDAALESADISLMATPQPVLSGDKVVTANASFSKEDFVGSNEVDAGLYDHDMYAFTPNLVLNNKTSELALDPSWEHAPSAKVHNSRKDVAFNTVEVKAEIALEELHEEALGKHEALHHAYDSILDEGASPVLFESRHVSYLQDEDPANHAFDLELDIDFYDPMVPTLVSSGAQAPVLAYANELKLEPLQTKIQSVRKSEEMHKQSRLAAHESLCFDECFDEVPQLVTAFTNFKDSEITLHHATEVDVVENQDREYLFDDLENEFDGAYQSSYGCPPLLVNSKNEANEAALNKDYNLALNESLIKGHEDAQEIYAFKSFKEADDLHVESQSDAELMSNLRKLDINLKKPERKSSVLIPIHLMMKNRTLTMCVLICFCCYVAIMAEPTLLAMYAQFALGLSPVQSGLIVFAQPLSVAITSFIVAKYIKNVNSHLVITAGLLIETLTLASFTMIEASSSVMSLVIRQILVGVGFALFSSPTTALVTLSVQKEELTPAFSMQQLGRMMGQGCSFALMMIALNTLVEVEPSHLSYTLQFTLATHEILGAAALFGLVSVVLAAANMMFAKKLHSHTAFQKKGSAKREATAHNSAASAAETAEATPVAATASI